MGYTHPVGLFHQQGVGFDLRGSFKTDSVSKLLLTLEKLVNLLHGAISLFSEGMAAVSSSCD